jgi:hypothetical protein
LQAIKGYAKTQNAKGLMQANSDAGVVYRNMSDYPKSEASYKEGIRIAKEAGIENDMAGILYGNLSQIYIEKYKDYDEAIRLLKKAEAIYDATGSSNSKEHLYRNLSEVYRLKKDYTQAKSFAYKSVAKAEEINNPHAKRNAYDMLYRVQFEMGEFENALASFKLSNSLGDSLLSVEKTAIISERETKYQSVKKEAEIKVLTKTNQLNRWRIGALLSGLVSLLFFLYYIAQKRRKDKIIFEGEKALEKERFEKKELELEEKKKLLTSKVLQLASKNDFLNNLQNEVVELLKESVDSSVNKTSKRISSMIRKDMNGDKQWEQFGEEFSSIHQGFIASLAKEFGAFTKTEVRLISLLKMNLSSKEIAEILSISDEGIKKARYRLRKKINLEDSELQGFLLNYS